MEYPNQIMINVTKLKKMIRYPGGNQILVQLKTENDKIRKMNLAN